MGVNHHKQQETPHTCVLACCRMLLSRRGEDDFDERELFEELTAQTHKLDLAGAAAHLGWHALPLDFEDPNNLGFIQHLLNDRGLWLVVTVGGPRLATLNQRDVRRSRHGQLATPGDNMPPHHAIVLTATSPAGLSYFDPWFPQTGQPFSMTVEEFVYMWTGDVCMSEPPFG